MLAITIYRWYYNKVSQLVCESGFQPTLFVEHFADYKNRSFVISKISDKVEALARPVVEEEGCKLWSVEYIKEAGTWYLRIFIDKDGGVGIADCEAISRRLDPILDEADPIPESYVFEVGSAGAERELKRTSDFEQLSYIGPMRAEKLWSERSRNTMTEISPFRALSLKRNKLRRSGCM